MRPDTRCAVGTARAPLPRGLHLGRRDLGLPDRGRGQRGRARALDLGHLRAHARTGRERRHGRRGRRPLPPLPRGRRADARDRPRGLPLLDRLAARAARRLAGRRTSVASTSTGGSSTQLLEAGIEPYPTLYHWDLPQELAGRRRLALPRDRVPLRGVRGIVSDALGDRVGHWLTLNEPWCSAFLGYGLGRHAPGSTTAQARRAPPTT